MPKWSPDYNHHTISQVADELGPRVAANCWLENYSPFQTIHIEELAKTALRLSGRLIEH